jgi:hypothetical protein
MITLFYGPHACSLASYITLEEAGAAYTAVRVEGSLCAGPVADERQTDEHRGEPSTQVHCAALRSIRLGSLLLTLPTRALTGQHGISAAG